MSKGLVAFMKKYKSYIFGFIILVLILRVIVPQLDSFKDSLETLKEADLRWVALGVIMYFSGVGILAVQFVELSIKRLAYGLTLHVEAATLFANKLVPNGVGTISLNAFYLVKKNHTPIQATAVVAMNSITSFIAYLALIVVALIWSHANLSFFQRADISWNKILLILLLVAMAGLVLYRTTNIKERIHKSWTDIKGNLVSYKKRPRAVIIALIFNGLGTSVNVITMICAAKAVGIDISFANALVAYTFGNVAATLVPTPGGIGSSEAGIYSGLVLVGLDGTDAMTVTLLYRFISYWLPILPGYYFFQGLRKDLLAGYSVRQHKHKPVVAAQN